MLQHMEHVARRMDPAADPRDRSTCKRWVRNRPSHDVKQASEGHDPFICTAIYTAVRIAARIGLVPAKRPCIDESRIGQPQGAGRRLVGKDHAADLVERTAGKPSTERQIAFLIAKRDPRRRRCEMTPSLGQGRMPPMKRRFAVHALLRLVDRDVRFGIFAQLPVSEETCITGCQKSLHVVRALLRTPLPALPRTRLGRARLAQSPTDRGS
jgi:hypothetical protein